MRRVYQTDETRENFFTTVFYAYNDETAYLTSAKVFQNRLDDIFVRIETESDKAERVRKKLASIAPLSLREIDKILRSCNPEKTQIAFEYLKLVAVAVEFEVFTHTHTVCFVHTEVDFIRTESLTHCLYLGLNKFISFFNKTIT